MHRVPAFFCAFLFSPLTILAILVAADGCAAAAADTAAEPSIASYDSSRIVSIGGSITEILYALGMQQKIVAVDTTSIYPPSALKDKPNVGYMRQLSAEGVLALAPTLVLAIDGSGPKEMIDVLQQANVSFISVPDKFTGDGIIAKIDTIARDVGVPQRGDCLAGVVRRDIAALARIREQIKQPAKVAFILSLANGRPMMAGRSTAAAGIIAMAGARNAFDDFDGYKMVNDEAIVGARPDAVLAMQSGEHALSADTVFAEPALAMTPAAKNRNLIAMDGLYLLGFGPRTARAARDLAGRLYPNIKAGDLPSEQSASPIRCDR